MSTSTTNILKSALRATAPIFVSPFHIDLYVLHSPLQVPYHYVQLGHGRPMEIRSRPYLLNLQVKAPGFGSIIHYAFNPLRLHPHQVQAQGHFSIFQSRQVIFRRYRLLHAIHPQRHGPYFRCLQRLFQCHPPLRSIYSLGIGQVIRKSIQSLSTP